MHELIARGAAAVRRERGWTQEQAARAYRAHGLASWRTSTVGSLESGLRKPRLDEVILMCAALDVTLAEMVRAADVNGADQVELGDGAVLSTSVILGYLYQGLGGIADLPWKDPRATRRFPITERNERAIGSQGAEMQRLGPILVPIAAWSVEHEAQVATSDYLDAFRAPSDAERHAARRLKVEPAQVRLAARALWRRDFAQERDARVGDVEEMEPRTRQARRGLVTREMLTEMGQMLAEASELPLDEEARQGKPPAWWFRQPDLRGAPSPTPGPDGRMPYAPGYGPEDE